MLPSSALQVREQCWIPDSESQDAGFYQMTSYKCPMFDQLTMSVRTRIIDGLDNEFQDSDSNPLGLAEEALKRRKLKIINVNEVWDCIPSDQGEEEDPAKVIRCTDSYETFHMFFT